jgi:ABC-type polysaccharide transport system permease subunit
MKINNDNKEAMTTNQILYIHFISEKYTEENVREILEDKIGEIEQIVLMEHNYVLGSVELGSNEPEWGRAAIIYVQKWKENDYTRIINFAMNYEKTFIKVNTNGELWYIEKYNKE